MSRLHIRYKAAAWLRGFIDNPLMRPPMPRPRREEIETLYSLFRALDLSVRDRVEIDAFLDRLGKPVPVSA